MPAPTRVELDYTIEDAVAVNELYLPREPAQRTQRARARLALGVVFVSGLGLASLLVLFPPSPLVNGLAFGFLTTMIVFLIWPTESRARAQVANVTRLLAEDPAYRSVFGRRVYELHPDFLRISSSYHRSELFWRSVVGTISDRDYYLVIFPGPAPGVFARNAVRDDADFEALIGELERRIRAAGGVVGEAGEGSRPGTD